MKNADEVERLTVYTLSRVAVNKRVKKGSRKWEGKREESEREGRKTCSNRAAQKQGLTPVLHVQQSCHRIPSHQSTLDHVRDVSCPREPTGRMSQSSFAADTESDSHGK